MSRITMSQTEKGLNRVFYFKGDLTTTFSKFHVYAEYSVSSIDFKSRNDMGLPQKCLVKILLENTVDGSDIELTAYEFSRIKKQVTKRGNKVNWIKIGRFEFEKHEIINLIRLVRNTGLKVEV